MNDEPLSISVKYLYDEWVRITKQPPRTRFSVSRQKKITARLREFSQEDLRQAIIGCSLSSFHMGCNDRNTRYNSIDLIFRNSDKVEHFMGIYDRSLQPTVSFAERERQEIIAQRNIDLGLTQPEDKDIIEGDYKNE